MRNFDTGATRDDCDDKYDYEGFYCPLVVERFGKYMHKHRKQADGKLRDSDNWQKGIPKTAYLKSAMRHLLDIWKQIRGHKGQDDLEDSLCATIFNIQGYLYEVLKEKRGNKTPTKQETVNIAYDNCDGQVELNYGDKKPYSKISQGVKE